MKLRLISLFMLLGLVFATSSSAAAQSNYSFSLDSEIVQVYWNADGILALDYTLAFTNYPNGHTIDYVDMGMPNSQFDMNTVHADVTADNVSGYTVPVSKSDYQGSGTGFAVNMVLPIYAGESGKVHVTVGSISGVLYKDSTHPDTDASAVFSPTYFGSQYVHGPTSLMVTFHLPPGIQPDEPRYHTPTCKGCIWSGEATPTTGQDEQGRITYSWGSSTASGSSQYTFGASFPKGYVPAGAIIVPPLIDFSSIGGWFKGIGTWISDHPAFVPITCNVVPWLAIFIAAVIGWITEKRRRLEYLPPKISIEGHGIKRGLTAVEAGLLMEEPLDKIMTMILFGVVKKNAATVISKDPLKLQAAVPLPAGLNDYETEFLVAFADDKATDRRKDLQEMIVNLVKSTSEKMKGFSRKETVAYYKDIMERAWQQIEKAGTPEVKSQLYDESLEWTMLDKNYDQRTRHVFARPFFVPLWWGRYDPGYRPTTSTIPAGSKAGTSGERATLPGSAMAASMVLGVQGFSSKVLGDVKTFTSGVSNKTNPAPVYHSSGGGGHSSGGSSHSSCACACAGCACACAGGGR